MFWAICISSLVAAGLALIDQMRRPEAAWLAADRDRGWWAISTVTCGLVALGVPMTLIYLIGVVPRFAGSSGADEHGGFGR